MSRTDRLTEFKICETYTAAYAQHVEHVHGHKIKQWNCNSAADCSISLEFGIEFHHVTGDVLHMFKVKGQGQDQ